MGGTEQNIVWLRVNSALLKTNFHHKLSLSLSFIILLCLFLLALSTFFHLLNGRFRRELSWLIHAFVLFRVTLDKRWVHWVEGCALLVLETIADVYLHECALVVEAVGAGPLERTDD